MKEDIKQLSHLTKQKHLRMWISIFALMVIGIVFLTTMLGEANLSLTQVWEIILGKIISTDLSETYSKGMIAIVWDIRLPRILCGVLVGAGLALSGTVFQALLMNPLADPYTIGISTGAALGATIAIFFSAILQIVSIAVLPAAFIGALGTLFVVIQIAGRSRTLSSSSLIVAGIIVSSIGSAAISLIKSLAGDEVSLIVFWLMGSLASRTWQHVIIILPIIFIGGIVCYRYSRELNILTLGEEGAMTVGVDVKRVRLILLITASMITAACVSVSGIIGFVGLVVPHILRQFLTSDHKYLIPLSLLVGGLLLSVADNITRVLLVVEIPVGVLTTLLGGPFFIYLFTRKDRKVL